jgi:flap endonuclease-1
MGVQHLNSLICSQCETAVKKQNLSENRGKRVAVDASIFMYRYKENDVLLENVYNLINILKKNDITPCFIFDGKPPEEKSAVLKARRKERENAATEYNKLMDMVENKEIADMDKAQVAAKLETLKHKMTKITMEDIYRVRQLLDGLGVIWIEAKGEADLLCAKLCIKRYVDACLSDDMDMFVYGCPVVWRHLSILQETIYRYDLNEICKCLELTKQQLREVCVASGTDYSYGSSKKTNLNASLKLMKRYINSQSKDGFYEWLDANTDYVDDMYALYANLGMFDTTYVYVDPKVFGKKGKMKYKAGDLQKMKEAMECENFFFPY